MTILLGIEDFETALEVREHELIKSLDELTVFAQIPYILLSVAETHPKQVEIFTNLKDNDLLTPQSIIDNRSKLRRIVNNIHWPNVKADYIYRSAETWLESNFYNELKEDIENRNRIGEFRLREQLVREFPGMGHKCASLFMNKFGYENVVTIDNNMYNFLHELNQDIKIPNYRTVSGVEPNKYREYEGMITLMANIYDHMISNIEVTPSIFQFAVYGRDSTWKKVYKT